MDYPVAKRPKRKKGESINDYLDRISKDPRYGCKDDRGIFGNPTEEETKA